MPQPIDTDADRLRSDDALQILATCRRLVSDRHDAAAANFGEYAVNTQKWDRRLSALTKTRRLVETGDPKAIDTVHYRYARILKILQALPPTSFTTT